eukprot:Hpha_TRINITY_DN9058_c0_g1::TRINITY_DN9058_c0_g1_i1::g.141887::m.141887
MGCTASSAAEDGKEEVGARSAGKRTPTPPPHQDRLDKVLEESRRLSLREGLRGSRRIADAATKGLRASVYFRWRRWARHKSRPPLRVLLAYAVGTGRLTRHCGTDLLLHSAPPTVPTLLRRDQGSLWRGGAHELRKGSSGGWVLTALGLESRPEPFLPPPWEAEWEGSCRIEARTPLFPINVLEVIASFFPCACDKCEFPGPEPETVGGRLVIFHAVAESDTFESLALRYGSTVADIRQDNKLLGCDCLSFVPLGTQLRIVDHRGGGAGGGDKQGGMSEGDVQALHRLACDELLRLCPKMPASEVLVYLPRGSTDIRSALREYYNDMRWEQEQRR